MIRNEVGKVEIKLTDEEAKYLIELLKFVFKQYKVDLRPGNKGDVLLTTEEEYEFILHYYTPSHRGDRLSLHLRERETNTNLVRINIDPNGFHKNSNGETIYGNRILIFSFEEWVNKSDGYTHVRAYSLPKEFKNIDCLEQVFLDFLLYINVKSEGKITFAPLL